MTADKGGFPSSTCARPTCSHDAAAFGFFAWQRGASLLGANKVLVYQYLITFVGVASGMVLLGEGLGVEKIIGGAVILLGVYLARPQ